jgi:hypothetical protein
MKLLAGWVVAAGLVLTTVGAQAQLLAPYEIGNPSYLAVSDVEGPYAAMPLEVPVPPAARYGPTLLPAMEVYTVLRDSGFLPLGIPQRRGLVYTISVIDRGGDDGRLTIDARTGRIVRFVPANRMGDNFDDDLTVTYGPPGPPPPIPAATRIRGVPRPPASIPHVASRTTVPMPKASPRAAKPAAAPAQQSAAAHSKPADTPTTPPAAAPTIGQSPPVAPTIQPTQQMPEVQGLE